jgi:uncharacterized membrane protein YsdA (DUF1294 family)
MSPYAGLALSVVVTSSFFLYLLPAIIASRRRHRHENTILALTVVFGWTVIIWLALFAWALYGEVLPNRINR